jgi:hypothetical protein
VVNRVSVAHSSAQCRWPQTIASEVQNACHSRRRCRFCSVVHLCPCPALGLADDSTAIPALQSEADQADPRDMASLYRARESDDGVCRWAVQFRRYCELASKTLERIRLYADTIHMDLAVTAEIPRMPNRSSSVLRIALGTSSAKFRIRTGRCGGDAGAAGIIEHGVNAPSFSSEKQSGAVPQHFTGELLVCRPTHAVTRLPASSYARGFRYRQDQRRSLRQT